MIKTVANKRINQFDDYSKDYSKDAYSNFLFIVGSLWYKNEWLWSTIPFMTHRWDDINKGTIERIIGVRD